MDSTHSHGSSSRCPTCLQSLREGSDALQRAHSLLLAALEATADGILVVDLAGRTVAHNSRFLEMWGIPLDYMERGDDEELRGYVANLLADPADFAARVQELYSDLEAESDDVIQLSDGRVFERLSRPQRLDGQVVGRVWSFRDITARREAEEARAASEASYRAIFDASTDAVYVHDVETGKLLDVNRRACELHGRTREELLEMGLAAIDAGERPFSRDDALARLRTAASTGSQLFEWQAPHSGGHRTWLEVGLRRVVIGGHERLLANGRDITDRKNAELALQAANEELEARVEERTAELARANVALREEVAERARAERELATIFQALPDAYFRLDADGRILDHRPGSHGNGLPPDEPMLGRTVEDVCPSAADALREAIQRVRSTGELVCIEYALPTENGQLDLEARLVPFGNDQSIAIVRDVTESRQSARELERSEEHFRTLIENGSDLIIVVSPEGRTSYLSPSAERILGWAPHERLGHSSFEMLHPDDVPVAALRRQEAIDHPGSPVALDFRYRHRDGNWRHFEAFVRTLLPDSADGGLVVNARDVTGRKAMESALKQNEEYNRTLIENSGDMIQLLDATGRITYTGPTVTRLLGWTPEEVEGTDALGYVHPDYLDVTQGALAGILANPGEVFVAEYRVLHKDGSYPYFEASARSLVSEDGSQVVVLSARDVTERRLAQDALGLAKEEAERAREAAEQANRAKSEFLSRMSHELRTPMNSILGFAQLLARRTVDDDQARSVDHILKAGRHLLNLINEVLDIARIESNRQHLSLEPVRIDSAITEALALIRPLAAQYDCHVQEPGPLPDGYVMADRQRLAQVLLNLLSNAVKYNRRGGHIWVTVEPVVADGDVGASEWRIGVHDSGPGIPAARMEELFIPFSRLGAEGSEVEGTGLGLALSQRLVEAMGGSLDVSSQVGVGSAFHVTLASAANPLERPAVAAAAASPRPAQTTARPATLLYIEDNLANLTLVETILAGRPEITLIPALQGRLGIDLARQHAPDLILLDLHLPDVPGDEVLARLRADEATRDIPVIVISADATPRRIDRLRDAGVRDYLTKPLDVDEFLDAIEAALATTEAG